MSRFESEIDLEVKVFESERIWKREDFEVNKFGSEQI